MSADADCAVFEGAMGFYDGIGQTDQASAYTVSQWLKIPVLLVVNPKGMGCSASGALSRVSDIPHTEFHLRHSAQRYPQRNVQLLPGTAGTGDRTPCAGLSASSAGSAGKAVIWD
ncbi:MAG: hypothetical protein ACLUOF_00995 [Ruminococcus sp.]